MAATLKPERYFGNPPWRAWLLDVLDKHVRVLTDLAGKSGSTIVSIDLIQRSLSLESVRDTLRHGNPAGRRERRIDLRIALEFVDDARRMLEFGIPDLRDAGLHSEVADSRQQLRTLRAARDDISAALAGHPVPTRRKPRGEFDRMIVSIKGFLRGAPRDMALLERLGAVTKSRALHDFLEATSARFPGALFLTSTLARNELRLIRDLVGMSMEMKREMLLGTRPRPVGCDARDVRQQIRQLYPAYACLCLHADEKYLGEAPVRAKVTLH